MKFADEKFSIAVSTVLSLADNALEYLKSSKVEQKREILNLVLSNSELNDGNLSYTVNSPFNLLLDSSNHKVWRTRRDSNPRPLASEANTLSNWATGTSWQRTSFYTTFFQIATKIFNFQQIFLDFSVKYDY